jgi:hypothetical protein
VLVLKLTHIREVDISLLGATGGVLSFLHAGNSAGNTTPQTGSYIIARVIV